MLASWRLHIGRLWQIGRKPKAGTAATPVFGHAGAHGVGAVTADEPPVFGGDHRSEVDPACKVKAVSVGNWRFCTTETEAGTQDSRRHAE